MQKKFSQIQYEIFRVLEEGVDDLQTLASDIATIRKCEVCAILEDLFSALQILLRDEYISFEWCDYEYSDKEKELLNYMETDPVTGDWKWHIAVLKEAEVAFFTLQGTGSEQSSARKMQKSYHAFGSNFMRIQDDNPTWDAAARTGLAQPTIRLKEKGLNFLRTFGTEKTS